MREFTGYTVSREIPLEAIKEVRYSTSRTPRQVEDALRVVTADGPVEFVLSLGPERVVSDEDAARAVALMRRSPSRG